MRGQMGKMIILTILILISFGNSVQAQGISNSTESDKSVELIVRVKAINVCMGMGTNRLYARELIPAAIGDKTYYGCCEACQTTLLNDPKSRVAIDPITKNSVDKATAVIGALPDGLVYYFETEETMRQFGQLIKEKE
ncbi:MAG: hypothetical protein IIB94_15180 [Candidatus Marinimicrobia bacterium]|nr:hypothetical protein [Candidatus Neomarinimicrobiota bacterium]